jgi:hypothetical protein
MANYNQSTRRAVADITQGIRVDAGALSVAAASTKDIFTVAGGNCIILGLVGESTTGQAAGANAVTWISTPTTGTAVNLSGGVTSIASLEAGGLVSLTGVFATATLVTNAGATELPYNPFLVAPGVIGFATAGNTAGSFKFSVWYIPAEDGAYIEAAY